MTLYETHISWGERGEIELPSSGPQPDVLAIELRSTYLVHGGWHRPAISR
jgi:hypothetical protein